MQFHVPSILEPSTHYFTGIQAGMEAFGLPGAAASSLTGLWGTCFSQSIARKDYVFWVHRIEAATPAQLFVSAAADTHVLLMAQEGAVEGTFKLDSYQACLFFVPGRGRHSLLFPRGATVLVEVSAPSLLASALQRCTYLSRESQLLLQGLPRNYGAQAVKDLYLDGVAAALLNEYLAQTQQQDDTALLKTAPFHCTQKDLDNTRKVKAAMDAAIHKRYTIRELASLAGTNRNMLNQAFQYVIGQTIHQYWLSISLDYARQLLKESGLPVKAIAAACGFDHYPHFIQQFKKRWGLTPGEMRKTT